MKSRILIILSVAVSIGWQSELPKKSISKNNMKVSWYYKNDRIYFEMNAPTAGWVTIGFNTSSAIKGNYLLMGRIVNAKPEVVEYYTVSAGNYKPITTLGARAQVKDVKGLEKNGKSSISFSLPLIANSQFQKMLSAGKRYTLLLAYSREDDFQHHSMMRTSVEVTL